MRAKRGRPCKPYRTAADVEVPGLIRLGDGRWRIRKLGITFSERDERRAVQRAMEHLGMDGPGPVVELPVAMVDPQIPGNFHKAKEQIHCATVKDFVDDPALLVLSQPVMEAALWDWMARKIRADPAECAAKTGIPELANLHRLPPAAKPLRLATLLENYEAHTEVKSQTRGETANTFSTFMEITGAQTLDDLTTDVLLKYRDSVRSRVKSPATVGAYFGRVKWVIAFGKTEGLDSRQIDAALSRLAVLKPPKDHRTHQPTPITREAWEAVYNAAAPWGWWQTRLLLMLNCCLHFDECLDLEWSDFNLAAGTFCTTRNKRGRVIRAATLWVETAEALKNLPRRGPYVFTSGHGTRFNAKGQWKTWDRIRGAAGHPRVQLDDIRDGSFTAACTARGVDEKFARLMAGHRSHGLQDVYVARNPSVVKEACQAVHSFYLGGT